MHLEDRTQEIKENENGVCLLEEEGVIRVLFSIQ